MFNYECLMLNYQNFICKKMKNNSKFNIKNLTLLYIGVATYKLSKELPQELKEFLPTVLEIEESLVGYLIEGKNEE